MKTTWVKGLSPEEKEEMRSIFLSNARFREQAIKLMQDKIESCTNRNTAEISYENANWALKQADSIGYARAMQEIISLFK